VYDTNTWGITEPRGEQILPASAIDLVFAPLLVFDQKGYRLGYGKGYYDRFLSNCTDAAIIGFSYFEPIREIADTHEFDLPLTIGITPDKL
uniref:5-formyltetrahydrofolate cyclo-ligase n=1 Tax=Escherichia coli TaxID=562 RepID=UPI0027D33E87